MTRYFRRKKPGGRENMEAGLAALGVAAGVAALTFYFTRLFLTREPLGPSDSQGILGSPAPAPGDGDASGSGEAETDR